MSFWEKIKSSLRRFMVGRNGPDELSFAILIFALVLLLVSSFFASWVLNLLGLASYVWIIFLIFSRNIEKRSAENRKYLQLRATFKTKCSQAFVRLKNIRKYKYFKCPECHTLLRLPRKVGEVTVTCGKCRQSFKQKA